ncbi:addiction module protein [Desulfonema magnum]|uniref:Addiction module domain-containing protein, CHP02574 n=1 Tax=Desulfonema magnum TaxID=45655 RepID=A0A975BTN2_9BACT|nr:addiction module protein [Desulfonema magnum]QTA91248.1 Addiction module domain-containing protein, CHP02574 [Desulfonema magnum]
MRAEEIRQEVSRLGLAEKLLLVEDVWDSIALGNSELPLPEWQKRELDKRYEEYKTGKQNLHDWKSVHETLRNEYK